MHPWLGILLVLALLGGLMALLRWLKQLANPHPEILRKLLHVGMGLVTLFFPWLFAATWAVWTLAAISVLLLIMVKMPGPLQRLLGGVVDGVERVSLGDVYFPFAVAVIFQFSQGDRVLYVVPILLLTVADAVAALIGRVYGRQHYTVADNVKSTEGSVAFFTIAFLCTHIPLLLFTPIGRAESLLLALVIGLLVMLIEAIAWGGLDNLLVPIGGFLLLAGYRQMDVFALLSLFIATLIWVGFVMIWRRRATLSDNALLGAAVAGYLTWTLGGWLWLVPPMLLFLSYNFLWPRPALQPQRPHNIYAIFAICGPGLLWLMAARATQHWELFYPYTVFYAAQLLFVGVAVTHELTSRAAGVREVIKKTATTWCVVFIPFLCISPWTLDSLWRALLAMLLLLPAAFIYNSTIPAAYDIERFPWHRQLLLGAAVSLLSLILLCAFLSAVDRNQSSQLKINRSVNAYIPPGESTCHRIVHYKFGDDARVPPGVSDRAAQELLLEVDRGLSEERKALRSASII